MQLNFLWLSLVLDLCRESMVSIAACLPIVLVPSVGFPVAATQTAYAPNQNAPTSPGTALCAGLVPAVMLGPEMTEGWPVKTLWDGTSQTVIGDGYVWMCVYRLQSDQRLSARQSAGRAFQLYLQGSSVLYHITLTCSEVGSSCYSLDQDGRRYGDPRSLASDHGTATVGSGMYGESAYNFA